MAGVTKVSIDGVFYNVDDVTAVDYSEDQELTSTQQEQARANIGGADVSVEADVSELKSAVNDINDITIIPMKNGYYINLSGSTADVTSPTAQGGTPIRYGCVECSAGDVFTVNAIGTTNGRPWAFIDEEGNILQKSSASEELNVNNDVLTAPTNSKYFVVNDVSFTKQSYVGVIPKNETALIESDISLLNNIRQDLDLTNLKTIRMFIQSNGTWSSANNNTRNAIVPIPSVVEKVNVVATGSTYIAFLKSANVSVSTPADFATGYSSRIKIDGSKTFELTSSCNYIYITLKNSSGANIEPKSVTFISGLSEVTEKSPSIATITGNVGETYTLWGITFTKITDHEFTLSGATTGGAAHFFNVLLGSEQVTNTSSDECVMNITTPGVYTLGFEVTGENYDDTILFAYAKQKFATRHYLLNEDTIEVTEDEPICLFVYAPTTANYGTPGINVKWSLCKGEDKVDYPYFENTAFDAVARNGVKNAKHEILEQTTSWGEINALALSDHIANIVWTPVGNMPSVESSSAAQNPVTYFSIEPHKGIPYSSVRDQDKAIGMDVSIHTFMTAVRDPNSVLYTRRSTVNNSSTYYGTVCSGMMNYSYGINLDLTNFFLGEWDEFEDLPSFLAIKRGDMLYKSGHVALIYDLKKDEYGRIYRVTVREENHPLPRTTVYESWAAFEHYLEANNYLGARRYKKIEGVPYTAIPYVRCFDEQPTEIVYPNVQTEFGDAAVFMKGEDVKVNVIDTSDFTTITVTLDDETVYTTSTIEAFTLENVQEGLYTITANGGEDESVSTFFVVDATASFDTATGVVTFSSTNAEPVMVNVYNLPNNRNITCKPIILTKEDKLAGQINVLSYMDENYQYAKVTFATPYGTAVWYSETHEKWTPLPET